MGRKKNLLKRLAYSGLAGAGISVATLGSAGAALTRVTDYARERGDEAGLVSRAIGTAFMGLISDSQKAGIIAYNNLSQQDIRELYLASGVIASTGGLMWLAGTIGKKRNSSRT